MTIATNAVFVGERYTHVDVGLIRDTAKSQRHRERARGGGLLECALAKQFMHFELSGIPVRVVQIDLNPPVRKVAIFGGK